MSAKKKERIHWVAREDGTYWATCTVGDQIGMVALVPDRTGRVSITALVEIRGTRQAGNISSAKRRFSSWLARVSSETKPPPSVRSLGRRAKSSPRRQ
jgi:hypothetical protein